MWLGQTKLLARKGIGATTFSIMTVLCENVANKPFILCRGANLLAYYGPTESLRYESLMFIVRAPDLTSLLEPDTEKKQ